MLHQIRRCGCSSPDALLHSPPRSPCNNLTLPVPRHGNAWKPAPCERILWTLHLVATCAGFRTGQHTSQ